MTLRARMDLLRNAFWPAVLGVIVVETLVGLALVREPGLGLFFIVVWSGVAVAFSWRRLVRRVVQRFALDHQARIDEAISDGDDEVRRRLYDETDEYYRVYVKGSERQRTRLSCSVLSADERWTEALALLAPIDRDAMPPAERVYHDNAVAWCSAHAGETARAVELARAAIDAGPGARMRPYLLGTLGAALVLDGQPAAALASLRERLALGGPRWAQAVRRYYLGEALAALGKLDEARAEWNGSVTIAPKSRWGRRAQQRLAAGAPAAYR
jgi:tetratricopeptide (TPR) repeat protein